MKKYFLTFELCTDATFGRGDGVAGLVDEEIQHDEMGCPYLGGKALKGILVSECADILAALPEDARKKKWRQAAERLFGKPGSSLDEGAILSIGHAHLPDSVRKTFEQLGISKEDTLAALTAIRWQTALEETGETKEHTLRAIRVIKRKTPFVAELHFHSDSQENDRALLQACVMAFRRAGTGRNRGKGKLNAALKDSEGNLVNQYPHFKNDYPVAGKGGKQ